MSNDKKSDYDKPDYKKPGVEFTGSTPEEEQLWEQLQGIPQAEPSRLLRQGFYRALDKASKPAWTDHVRQLLGLSGTPGLITAFASLFIGLAAGLMLNTSPAVDTQEFSALQQQVSTLHRNLVMDRLNSASANTRLLGVVDATGLAEQDTEIAHALLKVARDDTVYSVRSAAIEALGSQLASADVGYELMALFEQNQSPLVQLALVDLVLRYGNPMQLERLRELSRSEMLTPELTEYVQSAIGGQSA